MKKNKMIKTDKIKDFKDSNNMLKSTKDIVEGNVISTRVDDENNILDYHLLNPNKVWVDRDKLKRILSNFNNPISDHSSIIGDIVSIRLLKEDWIKLKNCLGVDEE